MSAETRGIQPEIRTQIQSQMSHQNFSKFRLTAATNSLFKRLCET